MTVSEIKNVLNKKYNFVNEYFIELNKKDEDSFTLQDYLDLKDTIIAALDKKTNKYNPFKDELLQILLTDSTINLTSFSKFKKLKSNYSIDEDSNNKMLAFLKSKNKNEFKKSFKPSKNKKSKNNYHINKRKSKGKNINNLQDFYSAVEKDDISKMKEYLKKKKIDPNNSFFKSKYPLIVAIKNKNTKAISLLLKYKANPKLKNSEDDLDAIFYAVVNNIYQILPFLLKCDKNLIQARTSGLNRTPLHIAAKNGFQEIAEIIIAHVKTNFPDLNFMNFQDLEGNTALNLASFYNRIEMCKLLVSTGAFINNPNLENKYPLHNAILNGNFELVNLFVNYGNINEQNIKGNTPLHYGINKSSKIINLLIKNGANPFIQNKKNKTPLDLLDDKIKDDIIKLIFECKIIKGNTLIHGLVFNNLNFLKHVFSLSSKINILIENDEKITPIDYALKNFKIGALIELLNYYWKFTKIEQDKSIYNIDSYYKDLKIEDILIKNTSFKQKTVELVSQYERLIKDNTEETDEFKLIYKEISISKYLLSFLNNLIDKSVILQNNIDCSIKINECLNIFKMVDAKMLNIIKRYESEKDDLVFIFNKYCNQDQYLEMLKTIAYYWALKAKMSTTISEISNVKLIKKALREHQKSISILEEAKKYIKMYRIEPSKEINLLIIKQLFKKIEFQKSINLDYDDSLNQINKYLNFVELENQSIDNLKALKEYELWLKLTELNMPFRFKYKVQCSLYTKAQKLFQSKKIEKVDFNKYLASFVEIASLEFKQLINELDENNEEDIIISSDIHFLFNSLFNIYFKLFDFVKCKDLCLLLKDYEPMVRNIK